MALFAPASEDRDQTLRRKVTLKGFDIARCRADAPLSTPAPQDHHAACRHQRMVIGSALTLLRLRSVTPAAGGVWIGTINATLIQLYGRYELTLLPMVRLRQHVDARQAVYGA